MVMLSRQPRDQEALHFFKATLVIYGGFGFFLPPCLRAGNQVIIPRPSTHAVLIYDITEK